MGGEGAAGGAREDAAQQRAAAGRGGAGAARDARRGTAGATWRTETTTHRHGNGKKGPSPKHHNVQG